MLGQQCSGTDAISKWFEGGFIQSEKVHIRWLPRISTVLTPASADHSPGPTKPNPGEQGQWQVLQRNNGARN